MVGCSATGTSSRSSSASAASLATASSSSMHRCFSCAGPRARQAGPCSSTRSRKRKYFQHNSPPGAPGGGAGPRPRSHPRTGPRRARPRPPAARAPGLRKAFRSEPHTTLTPATRRRCAAACGDRARSAAGGARACAGRGGGADRGRRRRRARSRPRARGSGAAGGRGPPGARGPPPWPPRPRALPARLRRSAAQAARLWGQVVCVKCVACSCCSPPRSHPQATPLLCFLPELLYSQLTDRLSVLHLQARVLMLYRYGFIHKSKFAFALSSVLAKMARIGVSALIGFPGVTTQNSSTNTRWAVGCLAAQLHCYDRLTGSNLCKCQ